MASRDEILGSIREALSVGKTEPVLPEPPEVWPLENLSPNAALEKFTTNLTAVAGEFARCADRNDAAQKMAEAFASLLAADGSLTTGQAPELGVQPGELTESLAETVEKILAEEKAFGGKRVKRVFAPSKPEEANPQNLKAFSASLVAAEFLLADTGSAVVRASDAFQRLLCYLSPVCFIAAKKSTIREHLPHAWPEIVARMAGDGEATGEFLLMTGPSRTADIEKILILGVHGPKKVVVFILENE